MIDGKAELRGLVEKAKLSGMLRGAPDEAGARLLSATITSLERLERDSPGILARRPRLVEVLSQIASACRQTVREDVAKSRARLRAVRAMREER